MTTDWKQSEVTLFISNFRLMNEYE